MKSGNPPSADDLKLIIQTKRHAHPPTIAVVSDASRWLKAALDGAGIRFNYSSCDEDHYGFAAITIPRSHKGRAMALELKIAEIRATPFAFAEVHSRGEQTGYSFPFFGDLSSSDQRELLLHYIADFIMSTES